MDRLTEKLQRAGGVVARQTAKIEARADAMIAREDAIEKQTDQAFVPHETILSTAERGLEDLERKLTLMGNGGPPLSDSTASPQGSPAVEPAGVPFPSTTTLSSGTQ